ncbi:MAG: hypothetical protein Q9175_006290 [Cornicularia normoerica]
MSSFTSDRPGGDPAEGFSQSTKSLGKAVSRIDLDGHDLPPSPAPSSPRNGKRYALATELVYTEGTDQYNASSTPIYQSATFKQTSAGGEGAEYDYTRSGNPTRTHLERHLAKIMGAERALVVSSGMGALDVITRLLRPGDEVVTGDDLYGGTNRLLKYLATNGGIVVHHIDTTKPESVKRVVGPKTAMILLETPTNPLIKIVDIPTIAKFAHEANPEALVAVDNTMLSPLLQNPLELGADIVYESGTKYLSGHHDLMAGVLAVNSSAIGDKLYFTINASGCGLAPFDSWLLMRGIKTLKVRMEQQQSNAQRIAEFLESHGFKVRYPGLKSHPQYELHNSMARGAGAVLSFETGSIQVSERIVEAAKLWAISVSFGCVNSLISMPCRMSHASIDAKTRKERALPEDIIRLCVGIEDADDLIDDLSRALVLAGAVNLTPEGFHAAGKGPTAKLDTQILLTMTPAPLLRQSSSSNSSKPSLTRSPSAIIENASNRSTLRISIRTSIHSFLTRPYFFLTSKPALLISALYFGTYATANSVDTISSTVSNTSTTTVTTGPAKFLATTSVNISLCLYKDSQFARMFGPPPGIAGTVTRTVPKASYALFAMRDSLTVFASFNLPPLIAPLLPISEEVEKSVSRTYGQWDAVEDEGGKSGEGLVREQFGQDGQNRAGVWGGWSG